MGDAKQVVERHVAAFNAHDRDALPWADDIEWEVPGAQLRGREQALGFVDAFWEAFPDAQDEIIRLVGDGPLMAGEGRFRGTHQGTLRSPSGEIPPTGRSVDFRWAAIYEIRDNRVVGEHLYFDQADLLVQLGITPEPAVS